MKYFNYDIVCQEIPDHVTLAINIANCPNRCEGCHSPWLWRDEGCVLDEASLDVLLALYGSAVSCVCFMGGDADVERVAQLGVYVKGAYPDLAVGWYSGREQMPVVIENAGFDYVKLGPYLAALGGLKSATTNQRLYRRTSCGQGWESVFLNVPK